MYWTGESGETLIVRRSLLEGQAIQDIDDAVGVDGTINFNREGFAGELVDHVQHLQGAAIGGRVELEVHRPDHVRTNR